MKATIVHEGNSFTANFSEPLDISIPLKAGSQNVNAWYCEPVKIEPVKMGDWIGEVKQGGSVNFRNVFLNPHGNGTHTECVGHISREDYSLNQNMNTFIFMAELITVKPEEVDGDKIITGKLIKEASKFTDVEGLVIRTLPNSNEKLIHQYSNTNPPYLHYEAAQWMVDRNIKHLLIDLPSVDREKDNGMLAAHHAFWQYPKDTRTDCTITELIYVDATIPDGLYLLNIQITALENDASPSKPVLYKLIKTQ
jgi:kynurenine formamidase